MFARTRGRTCTQYCADHGWVCSTGWDDGIDLGGSGACDESVSSIPRRRTVGDPCRSVALWVVHAPPISRDRLQVLREDGCNIGYRTQVCQCKGTSSEYSRSITSRAYLRSYIHNDAGGDVESDTPFCGFRKLSRSFWMAVHSLRSFQNLL